jgi:methanogenic corrinoid protein MtbC1
VGNFDQGLDKRAQTKAPISFADFRAGSVLLDKVGAKPGEGTSVKMVRLVQSQIIPRLLLANRPPSSGEPAPVVQPDSEVSAGPGDTAPFDVATIIAFTDILLVRDTRDPTTYLDGLVAAGADLDSIFVDLLAPAANYLGTLWELDECSFSDVTLALCTLHQLVRDLGRRHGDEPDIEPDHRVLLAPVPSNQHTFGVLMVEDLFRRSGWNVLSIPASSAEEIVAAARHEWFAVVGLSMSCDDYAPRVAELIAAIRRDSLNPAIVVLVGGRFFVDNPEEALRMGADATAADARRAIIDSKRYVEASRADRASR